MRRLEKKIKRREPLGPSFLVVDRAHCHHYHKLVALPLTLLVISQAIIIIDLRKKYRRNRAKMRIRQRVHNAARVKSDRGLRAPKREHHLTGQARTNPIHSTFRDSPLVAKATALCNEVVHYTYALFQLSRSAKSNTCLQIYSCTCIRFKAFFLGFLLEMYLENSQ
mgnify:CR=1 FL=1